MTSEAAAPTPEPGNEPRSEQQTQMQSQVITVNLQNSSDPALEVEILGNLHSAGRQLGRISAVIELLLRASRDHPALQEPEAVRTLTAFQSMRDDIDRARRAHMPEHYIRELERLRRLDPEAFAHVAQELSDWLERTSAG